MTENVLKQAAEKKVDMDQKYDGRMEEISKQQNRWIKVKSTIYSADAAVKNAEAGIKEIKGHLIEMRTLLKNMETTTDRTWMREQYDKKLAEVNRIANRYAAAQNLIGNISRTDWENMNEVEFKQDLSPSTLKMDSVMLSADWRITGTGVDSGKIFIPDLVVDTLQEYTSYPDTKGDTKTSVRTGMSVSSYDDSSGAMTFKMNYQDADGGTEFTGTFERGGLEVMGSWFHDNFETGGVVDLDKIQAAREDLEWAESQVSLAEGTISSYRNLVDSADKAVDRKLDSFREDSKELYIAQMTEEMELQGETEMRYHAVITNLQSIQSQQGRYMSYFAGYLGENSLAGLALDQLA
ncbi:MAG: hypothetical protein HQL40_18275 [Alphaproteobacteria bacterium]|nr:hypothetical protein [Alphaproteobacteria bacterium]